MTTFAQPVFAMVLGVDTSMEHTALVATDNHDRTATREASEAALSALTALIVATLKDTAASRFAEAQRLCEVAQSLMKACARRAEDFAQQPAQQPQNGHYQVGNFGVQIGQPVVFNGGVVNAVNNGHVGYAAIDAVDVGRVPPERILFDGEGNLVNERGVVFAGNLDSNALMRHMLMAFGPHAQTGAEANRARVAAEEATELKALSSVLETTPEPERAALQVRIQKLMTNLQARNKVRAETKDGNVSVVPPDDQRGHPADEARVEADEALRIRPDGLGDAGHVEPPRARPVDPVGAYAVV